jgi:2-oxoglutarate dehydrogenase E2 component (dihydrolipoamide succinyltransferase)
MTSEVEIRAPAQQTEGTRSQILRWLKVIGESVAENEPLIEIETDKVTVEVASPGSGVLRRILKQEQDEIEPGELLGHIELVGTIAAAAPMATGPTALSSQSRSGLTPPEGRAAAATLSPAVRRLLAEHGLDAAAVRGSGQGSRVTVEDVLRHLESVSGKTADGTTTPSSGVTESSHRVPHSAVRRRIADHMVQSLRTAPHVTTVFEANLSAVLAHRERERQGFADRGVPLTLTAYLLLASVTAIRAVPEANSRWTDTELEVFDSIHIGVATALETGLIVPVLRDVQLLDLFEIAQGLNDLVIRARAGRLTPADLRGGTFTISNHGVSGSLLAAPIIINQPQAAILGVGKLEKRAIVVSDPTNGPDQIVIQPRCYVTLTIDHRVMDGHQANRFLQAFIRQLETSPA